MTMHTPGPWITKELAFNAGWALLVRDKSGHRTHRIDQNGAFSGADARLIAAAPDLLAALYNMLEDGDRTDRQQALAAISKATGMPLPPPPAEKDV